MKFSEIEEISSGEGGNSKLEELRKKLSSKDLTREGRNSLLQQIIEIEEQAEGEIKLESHQLHTPNKEGDPSAPSSIPLREKNLYDLLEEERQLEDAVQTYTLALEETKRTNPTDFVLFKKINGALRGSKGVLDLVRKELAARDPSKKTA